MENTSQKKTKIVFIVSSLRKAGPIIVLHNIIRHIFKKYELIIIKLSFDESNRSLTSEFKEYGVHVYELNKTIKYIELHADKIAHEIDQILSITTPDLIHTHGYQASIVASKLRYKVPKVETFHNISSEDFPKAKGMILGTYMNLRYLRALNRFTGAVAISESVKQYYQKRLTRLPIETISNGIFITDSQNISKNKAREALCISSEKLIFLVIGLKDPITIIRSFKSAFPKNYKKQVSLLFLGKGKELNRCVELIDNDVRIEMCGWKPNAMDYLAAADWSISASHSEGFGLSYVESLIMRTPIIATKIPAFQEFSSLYPELKEFEFSPGNVSELREKLLMAAESTFDISDISNDAITRFSSEIMAKRYSEYYNKIINLNINK